MKNPDTIQSKMLLVVRLLEAQIILCSLFPSMLVGLEDFEFSDMKLRILNWHLK